MAPLAPSLRWIAPLYCGDTSDNFHSHASSWVIQKDQYRQHLSRRQRANGQSWIHHWRITILLKLFGLSHFKVVNAHTEGHQDRRKVKWWAMIHCWSASNFILKRFLDPSAPFQSSYKHWNKHPNNEDSRLYNLLKDCARLGRTVSW